MLSIPLKALAVTFVLFLGLAFGGAIGAPGWSQALFFAPAAFVYLCLDEGGLPSAEKLRAALVGILAMTALGAIAFGLLRGRHEEMSMTVYTVGIILMFTVGERLYEKLTKKSDSDA